MSSLFDLTSAKRPQGISNKMLSPNYQLNNPIDKENNNIDSGKFMKYLQLAADNNNATALYNLGDVYFSGKLGIEKDQEKGVYYLRRAALQYQTKAIEILKKHNISFYS